jgi:hypothetical protein
LETGILEDHDAAINRLVKLLRLPEHDMFRTNAEIVAQAYSMQGERIAYGSDEMILTA